LADASPCASQQTGTSFSNFLSYKILTLSLQADKWDPELLYRDIMDIDIQHAQKFTLASETKESSAHIPLHPRLACIIEETVKLRKNNEYIRKTSDDQSAVWIIYDDNLIPML
jgi:hypothetical protein